MNSHRRPPLLTPRHALFLDFDGTLVALADHPDRIVVPSSLRPLLLALESKLDGALALVTGRRLESLDAQLAPLRLRGAGLHGAQLRADTALPSTLSLTLGDVAEKLRVHFAGDEDIWVEDKGAAVAVHYRKAPTRIEDVRAALSAIVQRDDIEVIAGNCVFEARNRGCGKDAAIRALMRESPFRSRIPVFVGDDVTDEDGIREVQRMDGIGIKVGGGETTARRSLESPEDVLNWLERVVQAID